MALLVRLLWWSGWHAVPAQQVDPLPLPLRCRWLASSAPSSIAVGLTDRSASVVAVWLFGGR